MKLKRNSYLVWRDPVRKKHWWDQEDRNNAKMKRWGEEVQEKMESRKGGNVILQFILEELLPCLSDGYQLPRQRETQGRKRKTNWRGIRSLEKGQDPTVPLKWEREDGPVLNRAPRRIGHSARCISTHPIHLPKAHPCWQRQRGKWLQKCS